MKFGAKLVDREKTSDQDMQVYDGFDGDLLLSDVSRPGDPDFYESERRYTFGPPGRTSMPRNASMTPTPRRSRLSDADTIAESFGVDYTISEEVTAGYLMAQIDFMPALTVTGGVRVERTESDFSAYDLEFVDGDIDPVPPQVLGVEELYELAAGPADEVCRDTATCCVRAAWTNTIGRPSYEQNVPFRIFETEEVEDEPGPCSKARSRRAIPTSIRSSR